MNEIQQQDSVLFRLCIVSPVDKILEDRGPGFVIGNKYAFYSENKYECDFASHKHTDIPCALTQHKPHVRHIPT